MTRNPSISLTEQQQENIGDLLKHGQYKSVSEIMRDGLRLVIEKHEQKKAVIKKLEAAVDEALKSETIEDFDVDAFLDRKRKEWQGK